MTTPVLTFFNNKGGVGKTSLIYHLAWMFAALGKRIVAIDLDPQANFTAAFFEEDSLEQIWQEGNQGATIYQCVRPITEVEDLKAPQLQKTAQNLYVLPGDVFLSNFEDTLSQVWPSALGENTLYRPMRILSAFWQVMQSAASQVEADLVMVDIGPNLGAINRSALIAADYVVIPLGADLFSLQGLKNLGPTLRRWRKQWRKRLNNWSDSHDASQYVAFKLPQGRMEPIGYLCQQHSVRLDRPVKAYDKWINRIPNVYRGAVLGIDPDSAVTRPKDDPYCLATIKHYRGLIPMGQEQRKPIFRLTSADGAIGSHAGAVRDAGEDFRELAQKIAAKIELKFDNPY